jgi:M3 family oligoendopeptidase
VIVQSDVALDAIEDEWGPLVRRQLEMEHRISDPVNIELDTQLSDVLMRYTSIFGKATVTWRGETLPISFARKAMYDTDTTERRAAHASVLDYVRGEAPELQEIYDEAFELNARIAANLKMDSFVELCYERLQRFDWKPTDAASFRGAVERHLVPLTLELRQRQAREQGVDLVHPADTEIWREPAPELSVSVDGQLAAASKVFNAVGGDFGDPFDLMVREGLIDLPARTGKGTGAFCTGFSDQRVPYIFCNSVGSPDDVKTLVHEYGHALQSWRSRNIELVSQRQPTLEACEVHSMTLELLVHPYLDAFFDEGADAFREQHLIETVLLLPYIACVDHFQHEIYSAERATRPSARERDELWCELTRRYRPGIDWDASPDSMRLRWLQQQHVFQSPFYYLDYGLARMVSWQLWLDSLEDRDKALATYLDLCTVGGTKSFRAMVRDAGLGDPFAEDTIADTVARLRPHLGLD